MYKKVITMLLALVLVLSSFNVALGAPMKFTEENIQIKAGDHVIPGVLVMPELGKDKKAPAVLMLHGWASDKDEVGNMYKDLAEQMAKKGIASLRIDFAGSGDSKQEYFLNNQNQSTADAQKSLNYLLAHDKIDHNNVGVLGFSQGGAIGQSVVAREPQVKAFATWSTGRGNGEENKSKEAMEAKKEGFVMIDSFRGPLKQSRDYYLAKENSRGLDEISRNYRGALLVIAGNKDESVDPKVSKELLNSVDSHYKTLKIFEEGDHIFNVLSEDKSIANETIEMTGNWFYEVFK